MQYLINSRRLNAVSIERWSVSIREASFSASTSNEGGRGAVSRSCASCNASSQRQLFACNASRGSVASRRAYLVGVSVEPFPKLFDLIAAKCDLSTKQIAQVDKDLAMLRGSARLV